MGTMAVQPIWEAALSAHGGVQGVDRDNKMLRGYIVAEKGPFKSAGRGEFDTPALNKIVELGNQSTVGLKSRFTHPGLSSDGLGNFLGRSRNFRMDGDSIARADLHFDPVAFNGPKGNLAQYVMDMAESDPLAIGSSLVLKSEKTYRLGDDGRPKKDEKGDELPPLWMPTRLRASDIVDEGDATNSLLSVDELDDLPDAEVREVWQALDRVFGGQERLTIDARAKAFLERYLNHRFGPATAPKNGASVALAKRKLRLAELAGRVNKS